MPNSRKWRGNSKKFHKNFSECLHGHVECNFDNSAEKNLGRSPKYFRSLSLMLKNYEIPKTFCPIIFLLTPRMRFWQPFRIYWTKTRERFAQCPNMMINKFFPKVLLFFFKKSCRSVERSFLNPAENFFQEAWKTLAHCQKTKKKLLLFRSKCFS